MITAKEARELSDTGTPAPIAEEIENALNGVFEKVRTAAEKGKTFITYDFYSDRLSQEQRVEVIVRLQGAGYDVHKLDYPAQIWLQW